VRDLIKATAEYVIPRHRPAKQVWLRANMLDIIDQKRTAGLQSDKAEHQRLTYVFRARAKAD